MKATVPSVDQNTPRGLIPIIRNSVFGVLRLRKLNSQQTNIAIVGTAWCIAPGKFITAHHVLNDGHARKADDQFGLLRAMNNGPKLEQVPVVSFAWEDQASDIVVFDVGGENAAKLLDLKPIPISWGVVEDGVEIMSYGYPEPIVHGYSPGQGIQTAMNSRANVGIVAAQYPVDGKPKLEVTIDWFNGESGGPILRLDTGDAIGIMQATRNLRSKEGLILPGPRYGIPLMIHEVKLRSIIDSK